LIIVKTHIQTNLSCVLIKICVLLVYCVNYINFWIILWKLISVCGAITRIDTFIKTIKTWLITWDTLIMIFRKPDGTWIRTCVHCRIIISICTIVITTHAWLVWWIRTCLTWNVTQYAIIWIIVITNTTIIGTGLEFWVIIWIITGIWTTNTRIDTFINTI
jgi:hypothetical protein